MTSITLIPVGTSVPGASEDDARRCTMRSNASRLTGVAISRRELITVMPADSDEMGDVATHRTTPFPSRWTT